MVFTNGYRFLLTSKHKNSEQRRTQMMVIVVILIPKLFSGSRIIIVHQSAVLAAKPFKALFAGKNHRRVTKSVPQ
jgi:hypothetical protein